MLPGRAEALADLAAFLERESARHADGEALAHGLMLVAEELFMNAVMHGFASRDDGRVEIALERHRNGVVLVHRDDGPAFDPLAAAPEPDLDASLEDRAVGGLGLFLARAMTRSLSYRRDGGFNEIRAEFAIP